MSAIYKELINASISANDSEDAINQIATLLYDNGFVKESYVTAVKEREKTYPTGLQLGDIAVAMPHTDRSHVNKPAICIAKLNKPVEFAHMGDPDTLIGAEIIFMMAIQNPDEQVDTLTKVTKVFTSKESVEAFKNAKNDEELFEVAKKYLD